MVSVKTECTAPLALQSRVYYLVGAGDVVVSTLLLDPGRLPDGSVAVLIKVAAQDGQQRDQVEHGEHADTNHELH